MIDIFLNMKKIQNSNTIQYVTAFSSKNVSNIKYNENVENVWRGQESQIYFLIESNVEDFDLFTFSPILNNTIGFL